MGKTVVLSEIKSHISGIHLAISQLPEDEQAPLRVYADDLWAQTKRLEDSLVEKIRARRHAA